VLLFFRDKRQLYRIHIAEDIGCIPDHVSSNDGFFIFSEFDQSSERHFLLNNTSSWGLTYVSGDKQSLLVAYLLPYTDFVALLCSSLPNRLFEVSRYDTN
jgi:hypothetical protein